MSNPENQNIVLAQRLREYISSPHHTNPPSEACLNLVEDIARALRKAAVISEDVLNLAYWDFDARRKGYPPYKVPAGQECSAFKAAIVSTLEAASRPSC